MQTQALIATVFSLTMFAGTTLVILVVFESGLRLGRWSSRQTGAEPELAARLIITSVLGLLAFILGFAFRVGTAHYDVRNQALNNEAIAIGTAYHRADLLPEPDRSNLRDLLREYVDLRLQGPSSKNIDEHIGRVRRLQERIWAQAIAAGKANNSGPPSLVIQSLNDVIDVSADRVLANMRERIPVGVWAILDAITLISVAGAGYFCGLTGARRTSISALVYALVFAGIIVMIADVDVPRFGHFQANDQPLIDLRLEMSASEQTLQP